ncbi:MAG: hypothetical protein QG637_1390 [Chloroflexota bacterium]|nr:hypothetical protein [Chloroflexota bacterium]
MKAETLPGSPFVALTFDRTRCKISDEEYKNDSG